MRLQLRGKLAQCAFTTYVTDESKELDENGDPVALKQGGVLNEECFNFSVLLCPSLKG